jgi:hypothetical protein
MTKPGNSVMESTSKFSVLAVSDDGGKSKPESKSERSTGTIEAHAASKAGATNTKGNVEQGKEKGKGESKANKKDHDKKTASVVEWNDDLQVKFDLLRSVGEECQTDAELKTLLSTSTEKGFRLYDGFEPSGRMHIAQGVFKVNYCSIFRVAIFADSFFFGGD